MSFDEAKEFLMWIAQQFGTTGIEDLTSKDSEKMLEAIKVLENGKKEDGRWFKDGHHIRCSECGMYMCITDRENDTIPRNYCPNCGSKMEEDVYTY